MSDRKSFAERMPAMIQFVRWGIYLQIVGVAVLAVSLFTLSAAALVICMPIGIGLLGIGWLTWVWSFFKTL